METMTLNELNEKYKGRPLDMKKWRFSGMASMGRHVEAAVAKADTESHRNGRVKMSEKEVAIMYEEMERRIAQAVSPEALDPRYQAALDRFMDNRYWRRLYMRAPKGAKRYYERSFASAWPLRELTDKEIEEAKAESEALYRSLTDEDWDYIIGNTHWGMAKWGLNKNREKYSRKGTDIIRISDGRATDGLRVEG